MEKTQDETRLCSHCNKEVAELNFDLHESHCRRFLMLCPACKEPVPRDQLEQHHSEQHARVRCSQCNKKMERCHLQDHEAEECEGRLMCCRFCQLEVSFRDLADHTVACSSRTELCLDCGRYVKLQDLDDHEAQCSSAPQEGDLPQDVSQGAAAHVQSESQSAVPHARESLHLCFTCMKSFTSDQIWKHQLGCSASRLPGEKEDPPTVPIQSFSFKGTEEEQPNDVDEISTCPLCELALPLSTLKWHKRKCQKLGGLKRSVKN